MENTNDVCKECGTVIGKFGCCNTIRKLSRSVCVASKISKKSIDAINRAVSCGLLSKKDRESLLFVVEELKKLT